MHVRTQVPSHFDSSGVLRQTGKVVLSSFSRGHDRAVSTVTDGGQVRFNRLSIYFDDDSIYFDDDSIYILMRIF